VGGGPGDRDIHLLGGGRRVKGCSAAFGHCVWCLRTQCKSVSRVIKFQGLWFSIYGLVFMVQGLGFRDQGFGIWVEGLWFGV